MITILKPFVSVPQLSVTYLNVRKFVLVNNAATDCFVSLQVKSAWENKTEKRKNQQSDLVIQPRRKREGKLDYV